MNSKTAVDKIMKILGLTSHYMYEAKTEQGVAVKIDGDLELGAPIYVSTEEGMIPAPDGPHKLEDGTEIEVMDGKISKIDVSSKEEMEPEAEVEETEEVEMSQDAFADINLADGGIIRMEGAEPSVGLRVLKVGYDGQLSALADGEYETVDGKVIQIAGGSIAGVQSKADNAKRGESTSKEPAIDSKKEEMASMLAEAFKEIKEKLDILTSKQEALEGKFQKFSSEPAGSKVYTQKTINDNPATSNNRLEGFKRLREALSHD